jgi:hypothetical protein
MDTTTEIQKLETQLADADRLTTASADLRAKLARLKAADAAEEEARQRARERADAARDVREATAAERAERARPLRAAFTDLSAQLDALAGEADAFLLAFAVEHGTRFHARHVELLDQRNAVAHELAALGVRADAVHAPSRRQYVRDVLRRFAFEGATVSGARWEIALEEGD